ncbi:MAG: DegT/DnrJ/EryC1/StrS family aminotransferase [Verrucomicrobiota bacterium JB022]|nr:DegT/DnrJ/EryC1/StrS family aminotransferase [Verrucomicrobiota bacterium JB022]
MAVPLLDLSRQHQPLQAQLEAVSANVLRSGRFILSEEVTAFEQEVAAYAGAKHAISISSGTDALLIALMALGIGPGDEVLCPAFTFFATAGSVSRVGATPVWVDVREDDFNIDLADAESKIGPKTKAIIPVHLFGQMASMDCVMALAKQHNLGVVEDAAQSLGARYEGKMAGSIGDIGCYSFYPTKNLGGFGDGGMVTTQSDELAEKLLRLRNHGMAPRYYHREVGGNFRLDAIQCALLRVKLPHLESYHDARRVHAAAYLEALAGVKTFELPAELEDRHHVWNQFTIRVPGGRRDALRTYLNERKIGSEIYYPLTLDRQECFKGVGRGSDRLATAHRLADEVLSIPVFPEMTEAERNEVIEALKAWA